MRKILRNIFKFAYPRLLKNFKLFVFFQCCHNMKYSRYQDPFIVQSWFDDLFIYFWLRKASPDCTSRNLNKTSIKGMFRGVYVPRAQISLMLNVKRLCVVVDSLISAAKVYDCMISGWC